jgi:hypothetical protein
MSSSSALLPAQTAVPVETEIDPSLIDGDPGYCDTDEEAPPAKTPVKLKRNETVLVKAESSDKPSFKSVQFSPSADIQSLAITTKPPNKRKGTPFKRPPKVSKVSVRSLYRGKMSEMKPLVRVIVDITSDSEDELLE